jgi:glycosyltransferase involved in cell wall biosynthesis
MLTPRRSLYAMNSEKKNSVTIIVPFRLAGGFLEACCLSIQQQTHPHWEALLIDDGMAYEDSGTAIVEKFVASDSRFHLINSQRPHGLTPGPWWPRNIGLRAARFSLIAFLDADDLWHPRKLEIQLLALQQSKWDMCTTSYYRFDHQSGYVVERRRPPAKVNLAQLTSINTIPLSTLIIRRELLGEGFHPVTHEDHDAWIRVFSNASPTYYNVPEALAAYRLHQGNLTSGLSKKLRLKRKQLVDQPINIQSWLRLVLAQFNYLVLSIPWRLRRIKISSLGFFA